MRHPRCCHHLSTCISTALWYSATSAVYYTSSEKALIGRSSVDRVACVLVAGCILLAVCILVVEPCDSRLRLMYHTSPCTAQCITLVRGKLCWALTTAAAALIAWQRASGGLLLVRLVSRREGGPTGQDIPTQHRVHI